MQPLIDALTNFASEAADGVRQAQRVFHGRGKRYPGFEAICVDALWPTLWVSLFDELDDASLAALRHCLTGWVTGHASFGFEHILLQHRYLPDTPVDVILGDRQLEQVVYRKHAKFHVRFNRQNIGFFLDMEPGRRWLEAHCAGKRVLNLFSYTCVFSVVAQLAGAERVINVDIAKNALTIGRKNHQLNGLSTDGIEFLPLNVLKSWSRIQKRGPYDVVIIDPPSFQRGSFIAERDYQKVVRRLPSMLADGAHILACLNAPELKATFLDAVFERHAPQCVLSHQLPPDPVFASADPDKALKLRHYTFRLL